MPPPPIPVRAEVNNPPPIPAPAETTELPSMDEGHGASSSTPAQVVAPPTAPDRSARRRPAGAVATAMVSGHQGLPPAGLRRQQEEAISETMDEHSHSNNPYDLQAAPGSTVTASYPFQGDEDLQQLSFVVGDVIKVKEKEEMWSWGILERNGKEGWFPHSYVGSTFKPLPGIHELAAKLKKRREQQEGYKDEAVTGAADCISADAMGTMNEAGISAVGMDPSGTAGQAVEKNVAGTGSGPSTSDGSIIGGANGVKVQTPGEGERPVSVAKELEGKEVVEETGGKSLNVASEGDSDQKKTGLVSSSAAPSLPPFFKSSAPSSGIASQNAVTQRPADETKTAQAVDDTKIDGVGFAGEAAAVKAGCKCAVM